jgi:outer membrane protein assembly factor BamA
VRYISIIITLIILMVLTGCSNTKFMSENEVLYTGRKDIKIINSHNVSHTRPIDNYVKSITSHKVNNALFGRRVLPPIGLWTHYYWKPAGKKGFKSWMYKTLSSYPIFVSDVNPDLRASKIENDLFDKGYFHTVAWAVIDTNSRNRHKAKVSYFVDLEPPNYYNKVIVDTLADQIDSLMRTDKFMTEIKAGDQFNLDKLKSSRADLSRRIQDAGYFYFIPDFVDLKADTTLGGDSLNLTIGKKKDLPQSMLSSYKINNIIIYNSQGINKQAVMDTTSYYDGIRIISSGDLLKPNVLLNSLYFKKGDIYSFNGYQNTVSRLNNLGIFKSVNISYSQDRIDTTSRSLDAKIDLLMADNINLDIEGDLATKSSGYFGPLFGISVSHGNAFHGAERLKVGLTGGFEWQWGTKSADQIGTYSYQYGINSGLTYPRIILPFRHGKSGTMLLQRTAINGELSLLNRTAYYRMFSFKTNLNYQWSKNKNIQHSFYPLYVNSVNLLETTAEFDSVVNENIYIKKSFEEQFIIGPKYEFNYNNTLIKKPNNFIFIGGIGTSGNVIDLFAGMGKAPAERPYYFMNNIYSQYLKFTADFRYYRNGFNKSLVFRLYAGIGMPYGNSAALPYVEQFFSGGAYSLRGFQARYLGPGSFYTTDQSGYIDQSGDIKLESNLEFRFDMSKLMKGALFIETGNIWLTNDDPNRPGAKFYGSTFYDQLAVSSGFGLRFDFTFFVLRADFGIPLRNPYKTEGKNWILGTEKILSGTLFNLAIGYPF